MKSADELVKAARVLRAEVEEQLIGVIWTQLEKVLDSEAGVRHYINNGFIPKPLGIEAEYNTLMQTISVQKKFDKVTIQTFNKNVEEEVKKRMADLGWEFDDAGNIIPKKQEE